MSPVLIAFVLSALPCGVTEDDEPCPSTAGVPRGVQCWENGGSGSGIGVYETKWIDPKRCTIGSLSLTTVRGWATAAVSIPELPAGVERDPKLQAAITRALVPPPEDPKNPRHAIAHLKSLPELNQSLTVMPKEPWWPSPIPKQVNSSRTTDGPFEGQGDCPCFTRFDGERFDRVREWKVGAQTLSMWAYLHVNRGELAFAVTDADKKRHRWILWHHDVRTEPVPHLEGTRWYLPIADAIGETFSLLGYDASTGEAWGLTLGGVLDARVTDGGVVIDTTEKKQDFRAWDSLGPAR